MIGRPEEEIKHCFAGVAASKTFRHIVDTFDLSRKSVLDIGCGYGEFLMHFGPGSKGVTIVSEEVQYARKRGLTIVAGNIEDPDFRLDGTFDVVFANNLFEHLYSPHNFLVKAKLFLKKDGILILGVPCIPKIVSLIYLRKFRGALASNHINFFTRQTLIKTVERAGWTVLECRSFHLRSRFLDMLLHVIAPHFYVIAVPDRKFVYPEKRKIELEGYKNTRYGS